MSDSMEKKRNSRFGFNFFHSKEINVDREIIEKVLKVRPEDCHKGDFGHVLIIAGSKGYSGAAYLSTQGAVRSGAGLVTLCVPKEIQDIMCIKLTEAMTVNYEENDRINNIVVKSDAIGIGPGMGNTKLTYSILNEIILKSECPLVIDADGINTLSRYPELLKCKNNEIILTPHIMEFSRLCGYSIDEIKEDRISIAKQYALDNDIILLLKGHNTIVTNGQEVFINTTGNSAMASGGMGDVLTGIITSFIAQGYEPLVAAYLGAYVHGYAGDKLANDMFCIGATDLVEEIPYALKELYENF